MRCTGAGGRSGSGSATLTVGTPLPLTVAAEWTPATIFAGQSSTVTWRSENAVACVASYSGIRSETGGAEASGSLLFEPGDAAGNQVFTLRCTGVDGEVESASATLIVRPVVASAERGLETHRRFSPASRQRLPGAAATLGSAPGSSPVVYEASGPAELSGSASLPSTLTAGNATFTLSCVGLGGGSATVATTISIRPVVPVLSAAWNAPTIFRRPGRQRSPGAAATLGSAPGQFTGVYEASGPAELFGSASLPSTLTAGDVTFTLTCVGLGWRQRDCGDHDQHSSGGCRC